MASAQNSKEPLKTFAHERLWFYGIILLSWGTTCLSVQIFCGPSYTHETFLAWTIAALFNFTGLLIKIQAIDASLKKFFFFTFILNTLNLILFFLVVLHFIYRTEVAVKPFVTAIFVAYFTLLVYDILKLRTCFFTTNIPKSASLPHERVV